VSASLSGGPEKKVRKRRKIIREGRNKRLKSPVKINKNRRRKKCFFRYNLILF